MMMNSVRATFVALMLTCCSNWPDRMAGSNGGVQATVVGIREERRLAETAPLTAQPECRWVPDPGPCHAFFRRYYYNWHTKLCETFVYGGCDGCVPFRTSQQCEEARCDLLLPAVEAAASFVESGSIYNSHIYWLWWRQRQYQHQFEQRHPNHYSQPIPQSSSQTQLDADTAQSTVNSYSHLYSHLYSIYPYQYSYPSYPYYNQEVHSALSSS